jgi:CelD/BcsL family acetyltransferase involved in cellulose biosynthesis
MLGPVTGSTSVAEPPCPDAAAAASGPGQRHLEHSLRVERRPVASISEASWQRLAAANPWATPFSGYAFQRAWWEAYGENATDETVVVLGGDADPEEPIAILPLMGRHEAEPGDAESHTRLRHGHEGALTAVPGSATALFMGASYHADYATLLASPGDMPGASRAIARYLGTPESPTWDAVDLRRLRCGDPAAEELAAGFGGREIEQGWTLNLEREDVCPVTTIAPGVDFDGFLEALRAKDRHEIRRKIRRAEAAGEVRFEVSQRPLEELDVFIDLHQARWGTEGLFPPTHGGEQSRQFLRQLFERSGSAPDVQLTFLSVAGRRIASGIHFLTPDAVLYYNAGLDPAALELSPGILLIAAYVRLAIETGRSRLDFLRGDESYKYQWGAIHEPVRRLLVRRTRGLA